MGNKRDNSEQSIFAFSNGKPKNLLLSFFSVIFASQLEEPKRAAFCRNCARRAAFSSSSRFRSSCSMRISSSNLEAFRSCSICEKARSVNKSARNATRSGYAFARTFFSFTRHAKITFWACPCVIYDTICRKYSSCIRDYAIYNCTE